MNITVLGGIILLISLCISVFFPMRYLFYFMFFFSIWDSSSVININDNSIQPVYVIGVFFIIKTILYFINGKYKYKVIGSKELLGFIFIVIISLVYPILFSNKGIIVFSPSGYYDNLHFTMQNFTQCLYIVFGYIIYICVINLCLNTNFNKIKIDKLLRYCLIIVLLLGALQLIIPTQTYDSIFREGRYTSFGVKGLNIRISSVSKEPSTLSLFLAPASVFIYDNIEYSKNKCIDIILLLSIFITCMQNSSSTYFFTISMYFLITILMHLFLKKDYKIKYKYIIIFFFLLIISILVIIINESLRLKIINEFSNLIYKLNGIGTSGMTRKRLFQLNIDNFYNSCFIGIGVGTSRSGDLFSTLLAQVGIIGAFPIFTYWYKRLNFLCRINYYKKNNYVFHGLFLCTLIVLLFSVPDIMFVYVWIYFAVIDYYHYKFKITKLN